MAQKQIGSLKINGLKTNGSMSLAKNTLEEIMDTLNKKSQELYRFQILLTTNKENQKPKSVGTAYLREGDSTYTIRLWMFSERFYMIQTKTDQTRYLLMSREPSRDINSKNKYRWRIIGNGQINTQKNAIELYFDLLSKPILMSIYPENYIDKNLSDEPIEKVLENVKQATAA